MATKKRAGRPSRRRPVRFRVGLKRVVAGSSGRFASELGATKSLRSQMEDLEREFARVLQVLGDATVEAVEEALDPIDIRMHELVPVDTARLINSSYLEVKKGKFGVEAELGFARGGDPFYAVLVHEDLTMSHEPPTQAKFLQQAVAENIDNIMPIMQEFMRLQ